MLQGGHSMRKGQEEMVGFALVVVVLAVVGTVILGFVARTPGPSLETSNAEIRTFLDSLVASTSTCSVGSASHRASVGDIIVQCVTRPERRCGSGEGVCDALNVSINRALETHYPVIPAGILTGYTFTIQQLNASISYAYRAGNCTGRLQGDEVLLPGERPITVTFTRCVRV